MIRQLTKQQIKDIGVDIAPSLQRSGGPHAVVVWVDDSSPPSVQWLRTNQCLFHRCGLSVNQWHWSDVSDPVRVYAVVGTEEQVREVIHQVTPYASRIESTT